MRKLFRHALLALAAASLLSVSAALCGTIFGSPDFTADAETFGEPSAAVFNKKEEDGARYIVRETDGKIGIYSLKGGEPLGEPLYVIDTFVFTLPEKTAEMLKDGIECDKDGLMRLIEAFTS